MLNVSRYKFGVRICISTHPSGAGIAGFWILPEPLASGQRWLPAIRIYNLKVVWHRCVEFKVGANELI